MLKKIKNYNKLLTTQQVLIKDVLTLTQIKKDHRVK